MACHVINQPSVFCNNQFDCCLKQGTNAFYLESRGLGLPRASLRWG